MKNFGKIIKTERFVGNSFKVSFEYGQKLRSYDTFVVENINGRISLASCWDQTASTRKHVSKYLGFSTAEIRDMIKDGTYKIFDEGFRKYSGGVKYTSKGEKIE